MATKNLARTVIEGGRISSNKFDRRQSHKEERVDERSFLRQAIKDADVADAAPSPTRRKVYKEFGDKLGPTKRWMKANVGRPWNKVHSELKVKFDTRTTPGRHVLNDHMLKDVVFAGTHEDRFSYRDFIVAEDGILRHDDSSRRRRSPKVEGKFTYRSIGGIMEWLKNRFVVEYAGRLYWTEVISTRYDECNERFCTKSHPKRVTREIATDTREYSKGREWGGYDQPTKKVIIQYHEVPTGFRRTRKLSEKELQYWKTLHPSWKERILKQTM